MWPGSFMWRQWFSKSQQIIFPEKKIMALNMLPCRFSGFKWAEVFVDRRNKKDLFRKRFYLVSILSHPVMFINVIVDIAFPCRSFVFSQSSCEVSASLTDVEGVAVEQLRNTVPCLFLSSSLSLVSNWCSVVIGLWATRILSGCRMCEMFSDMPFMYGIVHKGQNDLTSLTDRSRK